MSSLRTALTTATLTVLLSACSPADLRSGASDLAETQNTYNFLNAPKPQQTLTKFRAPKTTFVSNKELVRMFADRTAYGKLNDKSGDWVEFTSADGRAIFLNRDGKIANGEWWVKNNQVCFAYREFSGTSCNSVEKNGSKYQYVQNDGTREFYITDFKRGDAADLATRFLVRQ